jgi:hypothetical protein
LGFSKAAFYLKQRKVEQKLANGRAELVFRKSAA